MKKIITLALCTVIFTNSCKKEDDTAPTIKPTNISGLILGKWNFVSLNTLNGITSYGYTYHNESRNEKGYWSFNADGSYTSEISYIRNLKLL